MWLIIAHWKHIYSSLSGNRKRNVTFVSLVAYSRPYLDSSNRVHLTKLIYKLSYQIYDSRALMVLYTGNDIVLTGCKLCLQMWSPQCYQRHQDAQLNNATTVTWSVQDLYTRVLSVGFSFTGQLLNVNVTVHFLSNNAKSEEIFQAEEVWLQQRQKETSKEAKEKAETEYWMVSDLLWLR